MVYACTFGPAFQLVYAEQWWGVNQGGDGDGGGGIERCSDVGDTEFERAFLSKLIRTRVFSDLAGVGIRFLTFPGTSRPGDSLV